MNDHDNASASGQSQSDAAETSVSPAAQLPSLDDRAVEALEEIGREWASCVPEKAVWEQALPVDARLTYADVEQSRDGQFVHIRSGRASHPEDLEATPAAGESQSGLGRLGGAARRVLVGPPLRSTAIAAERMRKALALPVLSPDALSSVAYGPEAMLAILVLAGSAALRLSLPISAAIVVLMVAVGLGYRQVIRAYPHGGGSYVVAGDNLGAVWGLLAGAGLIVDYILTVAVSVASGVAAVTSAIPSLAPATVPIGLVVIALLAAANLRGVRAAGATFAAPTYLFVGAIAVLVVVGLVKSATHGFHHVPAPPTAAIEGVGVLLILRAFSSGATAMTGIEVISNAVPVFKPPESRNARVTLTLMVGLLVAMFVGVVLLSYLDGIAPGGSETVLSKLAHSSVGNGVLYAYVQVATTLILLIAANSAFNGFPRLLFYMARDSYAPRAFLRLGDRLAFSNGVVVLAVLAALIYVAFAGQTNPLIPLFAVGVFLAFTLSQTGMVVHWWHHREGHWRKAAATNLIGAVLSAIVVLIAAATKFAAGAWVVVVLVPAIVFACRKVNAHYDHARNALSPRPGRIPEHLAPSPLGRLLSRSGDHASAETQDSPGEVSHFVVVAIAVLDLAALRALAYAASLGQPVLALHVSPSQDEAERFHGYWDAFGQHLPLEVVVSPYRATVAPLVNYIETLHSQRPDVTLTVVVPEIVVRRRWQRILHSNVSRRLYRSLEPYPGIVITSVPFHLPA